MYEPVHGSAPDIAGKGLANPLGAILTGALILRHSGGLETEAAAIETAVRKVLEHGFRTAGPGARQPAGIHGALDERTWAPRCARRSKTLLVNADNCSSTA